MAIYDLKIDIFEEIFKACDFRYKLYVLEGTIKELESFINGSLLSKKQSAKFAKKLLISKKIKILDCGEGLVDDQLVALEGYIIATVDAELKKRLKEKGVSVLTIRQKRYVVIE